MNVTRQMKIEFFHGNYLRVTSTRSASFNSKGGALAWLTNVGKGGFA
jgi:hypothetical protein